MKAVAMNKRLTRADIPRRTLARKHVRVRVEKHSEITSMNAVSKSFKFLENEPEIYSVADLKKRYA